jgi:hypothetical protein
LKGGVVSFLRRRRVKTLLLGAWMRAICTLAAAALFLPPALAAQRSDVSLPRLRQAVLRHGARERGALLCLPADVRSRQGLTVLIYTIEGACGRHRASLPGGCSNQWNRYLTGLYRGRVIAPIVIGGKARFQGQGFTLKGRTVDIQGTELGPADALCCPTQAAQRSYRFDGRRFVPLHDAAGSTAHP